MRIDSPYQIYKQYMSPLRFMSNDYLLDFHLDPSRSFKLNGGYGIYRLFKNGEKSLHCEHGPAHHGRLFLSGEEISLGEWIKHLARTLNIPLKIEIIQNQNSYHYVIEI